MKAIVLTLLCIPVLFILSCISSDDCTSSHASEVWPTFSACVV